jgi:hypothetical protein
MVLSEDNADMSARVDATVRGLRGMHCFSLNGSTSVDFELASLSLKDLVSGQDVVEWAVLDKALVAAAEQSPFVRAEARTSAPIRTSRYFVTVYELLQVNLFPGARYSLRLRVSKDLAGFVRRYFTEDDEDEELGRQAAQAGLAGLGHPHVELEDEEEIARAAELRAGEPGPGGGGGHNDSEDDIGAAADMVAGSQPSSPAPGGGGQHPRGRMRRFSQAVKGIFASTQSASPALQGGGRASSAALEDEDALQQRSMGEDEEDGSRFGRTSAGAAAGASMVVRSGWVARLSVPKQLQLHPEPTVQPWASTRVRRNFLLLILRPKVGAVLELHRNDIGLRLFVPRARWCGSRTCSRCGARATPRRPRTRSTWCTPLRPDPGPPGARACSRWPLTRRAGRAPTPRCHGSPLCCPGSGPAPWSPSCTPSCSPGTTSPCRPS